MKPPSIYLLDPDTLSYITSARSQAARRNLKETSDHTIVAISTVTEGEILFGLLRRPEAWRLHAATAEVFQALTIFPWKSEAAAAYASLRLRMMQTGKSLTANDALIAAHALALSATLVTRDTAFEHIDTLRTVNWATDI